MGEGGKRRVFRQADAGRLEGPLKGVKHRDAGDRDQTQRFDGYVARGFGLHDVLSYRFFLCELHRLYKRRLAR